MKITHYEQWWFDSIAHFPSLHPLLWPCANEEQVCVCPALSCSHSQVLTVWITSSSVSNFVPQIESFRAPHTWKSVDARLGQHCPTKFCDGFPYLQTSVQPCIVMLKQDCCWIFVRLYLFERLPELSLSWCRFWSLLFFLSVSHPLESLLHSPRRQWLWPLGDFLNFFWVGRWGVGVGEIEEGTILWSASVLRLYVCCLSCLVLGMILIYMAKMAALFWHCTHTPIIINFMKFVFT